VAIAIGVPALSSGGGSLLLGVNLIVGAAVCLAAVLIRRQRRLGVLVVLLAWALPTVVAVLSHHTARGSLLLFVALLFAGANWKHFN